MRKLYTVVTLGLILLPFAMRNAALAFDADQKKTESSSGDRQRQQKTTRKRNGHCQSCEPGGGGHG
jgi:hypothetical protein